VAQLTEDGGRWRQWRNPVGSQASRSSLVDRRRRGRGGGGESVTLGRGQGGMAKRGMGGSRRTFKALGGVVERKKGQGVRGRRRVEGGNGGERGALRHGRQRGVDGSGPLPSGAGGGAVAR
jgi:hypothetical protein